MQLLKTIMETSFTGFASKDISVNNISTLMAGYMGKTILIFIPIVISVAVVGLVSGIMQIGMKIAVKSIIPDFTRLDPIKGITRMFSMRSGVELVKSIIKVAIVSVIVYTFLKNEFVNLPGLADTSFASSVAYIADLCWRLLVKSCMAILVLSILDYIYQRYQHESSLKMTKQEVKDEYKRSEGDPKIKAMIKQRQSEMTRKRSLRDVSTADVIVTNPTHIAVALKYNPEKMSAPTVVAKGQRLLAERIKSIAETSGVPIVENIPVARALYKNVEVGQQVPDDLYRAVAEILAYVYRMGQKSKRTYNNSS
jgi:flagellar biosynthetic protein FlhB